MRVAVATATTPPRQATPTHPAATRTRPPGIPRPGRPSSAPGSPRQGRLRRRPGERSAHLDPGRRSHDPKQLSRTRDQAGTPNGPRQPRDTTPQITKNQAQDLQSLDVPLHMSAQIRAPRRVNTQVNQLHAVQACEGVTSRVGGALSDAASCQESGVHEKVLSVGWVKSECQISNRLRFVRLGRARAGAGAGPRALQLAAAFRRELWVSILRRGRVRSTLARTGCSPPGRYGKPGRWCVQPRALPRTGDHLR